MGNRANIHTKSSNSTEGIYFYTHWDGAELPKVLQSALSKKLRWDNEQYLNRIIFCEMIKDDVEGETGYGITTYLCDNSHDIIEVDMDKQTVMIGEKHWTFDEFIKENLDDLEY